MSYETRTKIFVKGAESLNNNEMALGCHKCLIGFAVFCNDSSETCYFVRLKQVPQSADKCKITHKLMFKVSK